MQKATNPAFAFLVDFSAALVPEPPVDELLPEFMKQQAEEIARVSEDAFQSGFAAGRESASEESASLIARMEAQFEERLADARAAWNQELASHLTSEIETGIGEISSRIQESVASLLEPWLTQELHQQVMREFNSAIDRAIQNGSKIEFSGPEQIIQALAERLENRRVAIELAPQETTSLRAKIDDVLIETDFAAWIARLKEVVHERR